MCYNKDTVYRRWVKFAYCIVIDLSARKLPGTGTGNFLTYCRTGIDV
jgi:hypothetical protein